MNLDNQSTSVCKKPPTVTSLQDLTIIEAWDRETNKPKYCTFYLVTPEEEVYFGESAKNKRELSFQEFTEALELVKDEEIYPEVPKDVNLTIAPDNLDDTSSFTKRPGLNCYEVMKGSNFIPKSLLDETLMMEKVSKMHHPNIIRYYGCRVRRGRITSIVLELLDKTLAQYVDDAASLEKLDKSKFMEAIASAVDSIHSLGLAHNDINPHNIMVKNGQPILIDFGSCQPVGNRLQSTGTPGWYEEHFFTSEKKHDTYSLGKLREWLEKPDWTRY